jgi:predicted nucleic acid-binding protein
MLILDTNVLSVLLQDDPDSVVVGWLNRQPTESLWITTISIFEVRYGFERLPHGKNRKRLEDIFGKILEEGLEDRILSFDSHAGECAARLAAKRVKIGRTIDFRDTAIAGIAIARRGTIITRNTKHFADLDVKIINPWRHTN